MEWAGIQIQVIIQLGKFANQNLGGNLPSADGPGQRRVSTGWNFLWLHYLYWERIQKLCLERKMETYIWENLPAPVPARDTTTFVWKYTFLVYLEQPLLSATLWLTCAWVGEGSGLCLHLFSYFPARDVTSVEAG